MRDIGRTKGLLYMNAGLIVAGGKSERLSGYDIPKQFIEIGGKPLVMYCLRAFELCHDIDIICVVVAEEWRYILGDTVFANPGKSRQHSIYNGLLALAPYDPEMVVIHDAARPLVDAIDISNVIKASSNYDGATPVIPVTDTIYRSFNGITITEALNRDEIYAGQTPECYNFRKYLAIHSNLSDNEISNVRGSSEIAVISNLRIALCEGNPHNFKVTTNSDLERFRAFVENGEQ